MNKGIGSITFDGNDYLTLEVMIDGAYNYFAEEELEDAITANSELGGDLDNRVVFYPTLEQLYKMEEFVNADDIDGLKKYLQSEEIFYYKLEEGKLVSGIN